MSGTIRVIPVTPQRWPDLVSLFGPRGACAGCWCMHWRRLSAAFERGKGRGNREALRRLIASGATPGLLPHRRQGVSVALLEGAAAFALEQGARVLEGYPVEPRRGGLADVFAWTGTAAAFRAAGFTEADRRSPTRPIMRRVLHS